MEIARCPKSLESRAAGAFLSAPSLCRRLTLHPQERKLPLPCAQRLGLELYASYRIVFAMHGCMGLESCKGQGMPPAHSHGACCWCSGHCPGH